MTSGEPRSAPAAGAPAPTAPSAGGWRAPRSPGRLAATVELPGSKSLTNRMLILAAISSSPTRITAPLRARDTLLMAQALRALGASVIDSGPDWIVTPAPLRGGPVDCGLAGTVMRFVPPIAALASGDSRFDGDPQARLRPMVTLIDGLRQAGVEIDDGGTGRLPFTVAGQGSVPGGRVELDASASSQFVSALLLAGARFDKGVEIVHVGGPLPSLPHIAMTLAVLRSAGVTIDDSQANRWRVGPAEINLPDTVIEPDLSNAAPFLGAALISGGSVTIPRWPSRTTQAGDALRALLADLGARVELRGDGLTVTGTGRIQPLTANLGDVSELTPVLAALCALADGESRLSGVAHIRGHETDRLAAIRAELTGLGGDVEETADGLVIRPARLHGGEWHAYADHRMAQAGALLGLTVDGVVVDDIASTTKTIADFPALWSDLLSQVSRTGA
jgi:3-phosphoshikimate 1-carboxyvinyltransferase